MCTTDIILTLHLRKLKCRFKVLPNAIHNESAEKLKLTHTLNYFSIDSQTLVYIRITWVAYYELWFLPGNFDAGILWTTSWRIPLNTKRSICFLLKVLFALYKSFLPPVSFWALDSSDSVWNSPFKKMCGMYKCPILGLLVLKRLKMIEWSRNRIFCHWKGFPWF